MNKTPGEYSQWLQEGFYIRLYDPATGADTFHMVDKREPTRYVHKWSEQISTNVESGPEDLENIKPLALNRFDQAIFGVKGGALIYMDLPHGTRIWGTDKKPKATSDLRRVGWVDEEISPYDQPSFVTEFFMQKGGGFEYPHIYAYNPTPRTIRPWVRFEINQMILVNITRDKYPELYDKLARKVIPYRPITMGGIPIRRTGAG